MSDEFFLSSTDSSPMYSQIMAQIVAKVSLGDWLPGQALPSIRDLAVATQVSVITVKRAYLELERAGVIVTRQGKGSFVAENQDLPRKLALADFDAHLAGMRSAAATLGMSDAEILNRLKAALAEPLTNTAPTKR